jgi:predicted MFS family arabinose efflux permease
VTTADIATQRQAGHGRAVVALGVTQMTAWGTTYYLPAVLSEQLKRDLGLTPSLIFSGIAIMMITSAVLAWPMGRLMDRNGAGQSMPAGSLFLALGLAALGTALGYWTYALAWMLFGIGMSLAMGNATQSAMAQIAGQKARRSIVIVMLFGGMASTVYWPLTLWLEGLIGWRNTCFIFAGMHALVCAPLHRVYLAEATSAERRRDRATDEGLGAVPPRHRRLAAALVVVAVACNGFVSWGLDLHLIAILRDFGLTAAMAVAVAALKGPSALVARGADILLAGRVTPMTSALVAGAMMPVGIALPLTYAAGLTAGVVFITVYSFGAGLMTVARATLPLWLLGSQGYAVTVGKLALPTQMIYAVSPMAFGLFLERFGLTATLWAALAASLAACGALVLLARLLKR